MASRNMRIGPTIQFCTSESVSTLKLRNTLPNSSYLTFARGGYIIRIKPMAMGIVGGAHLESVDDILAARIQPAAPDADKHGQKNPERQEPVEKGKPLRNRCLHHNLPIFHCHELFTAHPLLPTAPCSPFTASSVHYSPLTVHCSSPSTAGSFSTNALISSRTRR